MYSEASLQRSGLGHKNLAFEERLAVFRSNFQVKKNFYSKILVVVESHVAFWSHFVEKFDCIPTAQLELQ